MRAHLCRNATSARNTWPSFQPQHTCRVTCCIVTRCRWNREHAGEHQLPAEHSATTRTGKGREQFTCRNYWMWLVVARTLFGFQANQCFAELHDLEDFSSTDLSSCHAHLVDSFKLSTACGQLHWSFGRSRACAYVYSIRSIFAIASACFYF